MNVFYIDIEKLKLDKTILQTFLKDRKFTSKEKEKQHCYGRFLVEKVAKDFLGIKNSELEVVNKKPRFKYSEMHFSISHSENIVLVAFDKNPIGADIEIMKERNFKELFARYNYKGNDISKELFYKFWTEYEAGIKLQGSPKTKINFNFLNDFMVTIVGNFEAEYKIYELTSNGFK
ncbi:hypothetical protein IJZ97_03150 [bacterium]|nr:hypothetical protein [bacterium]